ncbi:MAG: family 43 glycosylhydrolase [Lachnospiraceae bacterium]|nr:family 43 glycosylhydrolase [Lachnospiraceae bacterium]
MNPLNPLKKALKEGSLPQVADILTDDPSLVNDPFEPGGLHPALYAAAESSFEILRYLVEYSRASLDISDSRHRNILHYAVESADPERCVYLVRRCGMDILAADRELMTPFELAFRLSRGEMKDAVSDAGRLPSAGRDEIYRFFVGILGAPFEETYRNPIRRGFFPDPSVVAVGKDFYMVNSSFIYFPAIPISHSRDLIHWEIIGFAVTDPEKAGLNELEGGRGFWAPDISYDNGTFYITATYRLNDGGRVLRRQIVVSANRPEGPYSEPAFIDEDGIDPSLFHEDGRHYMLLNRGARLLELSSDCKRQISPARLLYYGSQKHAPEGSHLLKKDGFYYLFQAEGGTGPGHRVTAARSRELYGIYEPCPYNPILRQTDPEAGLQRCGHGKPFKTPDGSWYMAYLCGRTLKGGYTILGRETALDPLTFTEDGWPLVNGLKGPSALQLLPDFVRKGTFPKNENRADQGIRPLHFVTPRAPEEGAVRFLPDGTVRLLSSPAPLSSIKARNILLRRQEHFDFTARALLALPALSAGQEAGLICYYDENSWAAASVLAGEDGLLHCLVKEHIGKEDILHESPQSLPASPARLSFSVKTRGLARSFRTAEAGPDGKDLRELFEIRLPDTSYLADEGLKMGKRFTGAMVGVFGVGVKEPFACSLLDFQYAGD